MPPKRCPECGRFLANEFVASLATASAPCPRCGTSLAPDDVVGGGTRAQRSQARTPEAAPTTSAASTPAAATSQGAGVRTAAASAPSPDGSVRPPDLDPTDVRRQDPDVLAGWDRGATAEEVASWRADRRPFPTDTIVVVGGAVLGAVAAGLLARRHRPAWIAAGAIGGAGAAGASRRIWELRP